MDKTSMISAMKQPINYTPYGFRKANTEPTAALGFNGEFLSLALGCYALGNGHRIYNPRLMRFISPDRWSPFFKGGLNSYVYCLNDPVNAKDPSGRAPFRGVISITLIGRRALSSFSSDLSSAGLPSPNNGTLSNRGAHALGKEVLNARISIKTMKADYTEIATLSSLLVHIDESRWHKFILTKDNKFAIFSADSDQFMPTHAALAEFTDRSPGASDRVVSAGYISNDSNTYTINHYSGHYRPPVNSLNIAAKYLRSINATVEIDDTDFDAGF